MRAALLALLLAGCATPHEPQNVAFRFACQEGILLAGAAFDGVDGIFVAPVGRCLGDLRIIGLEQGTGM